MYRERPWGIATLPAAWDARGVRPRGAGMLRGQGRRARRAPLTRRFLETQAALGVGSRLVVGARRRWGRGGAERGWWREEGWGAQSFALPPVGAQEFQDAP